MKKYFKPLLTIFIVIGFIMSSFFFFQNTQIVNADGDDGEENIISIGFETENKEVSDNPTLYIAEKNNGENTLKVCISEIQETDTIFTLTENIVIPDFSTSPDYYDNIENSAEYENLYNEWEEYWQQQFAIQGNIFNYNTSYVLRANESFVNIVLTQNANAENIIINRLRQIVISTSNENIIPGGAPTIHGLRAVLNVVVYDLNGDNSIIIVPDNSNCLETTGYKNFKIIRTGDNSIKAIAPSFNYKLINYDINNEKELKFETTQSTYIFKIVEGKYETEANLKLKFYDNNYLNWQSVFTLQFSNFVNCGTQYLSNHTNALTNYDEDMKTSFYIEDDEWSLLNYDAMIVLNLPQTNPFIRSEENYNAVLPEEDDNLFYEIYVRPSTNKSVSEFRLFYTINFEKTSAELGVDFNLANYSINENVGYVDFDESEINEDSIGLLNIETLNNNLLDGARTIYLQFFLSDENADILLPAKDFLSLAIWDDEYIAENNTISWADSMEFTGAQNTNSVVSFNSTMSNCFINLDTDYNGNLNYAIPILYTDITTEIGVDYNKSANYDLLTLQSYENGGNTFYYWGTNLNILNNGLFYGTKRLQVTILEELLPEGFSLVGSASIYVNLVGDYEKDYFYSATTNLNFYRDDDITFTVKRDETTAYTTHIDLQNTSLVEGEHYETNLFPFAINWEENETEKNITIPLLNFYSSVTDFYGNFVLLDSEQNAFDLSFENQNTSINFTLINEYEMGEFYFGLNEYTYLTSVGNLFVEVMRTSNVGTASINYSLTELTELTENERAVIGIDIDNINGTLTFLNGETLKTIEITIPEITRKIVNRKIGLTLSDATRYSTIQEEQIVITVNDDTWPFIYLNKGSLSTTDLYGTDLTRLRFYPVTNSVSQASFSVGITASTLPIDAYTINFVMYSKTDASAQGIEVIINDEQVDAIELLEPYIYLEQTYNYAYSYEAHLNKDNNSFVVVFNYENIYDILPVFAGNMFCATANCETIEDILTNVTISAETSTANMPTISMALDDDTIGCNDTIAITVARSWENIYLRQSFRVVASGGLMYQDNPLMYEPLDSTITFEPFEEEKVVIFYSKSGDYTVENEQPKISLYDINNNLIDERDILILTDTTSVVIKLDVTRLGNDNFCEVGLGKTVQMLFKLNKTWNEEISITLTNLPIALSTTPIVFPVGVTEVAHNFNIDGLLLDNGLNSLFFYKENFPTSVNGNPLSIRFNGNGWYVYSGSYNVGIPKIEFNSKEIKENENTIFKIDYNANNVLDENLTEKLIYCELDGTAEYGVDYILTSTNGNTLVYNATLQAFIVPAKTHILDIKIKTFNDKSLIEQKTIIFNFYELNEDVVKYAERSYTVKINNNDSYGKILITKQQTENGFDLILKNTNNTALALDVDILLNNFVGEYGVDYTITNYDEFNNDTFTLNYNGINETKTLHIEHLTNTRCIFDLEVINYPTSHIEILTKILNFTLMNEIPSDIIDEVDSIETILMPKNGVETNYYFDYFNENYNKYLSGNATFVEKQVDIYNNGVLYNVIYNYKTINEKIVTTVKISNGTFTSNEFTIPSKVNANNFYDINNDSTKEMLYISCYPYSFYGGLTEFNDFGKYGVYYIDFINNDTNYILPLTKSEVINKFIDINLLDLTCDNQNEIAVFIQNAPYYVDNYNYTLGDNLFYIISNISENDMQLEIVYFNSGNQIINNIQMRLVYVNYYNEDYEVPYIVLKYIKQSDYNIDRNFLNSNYTIIAKSLYGHGKYKNISIDYIPNSVIYEGSNLIFNVFNGSKSEGTFTITYEGITAVALRDFAVSGIVNYSFRQGERNKEISVLILNNNLPCDNLTFKFTIDSEDFYLGRRTENIITIKDVSTINKNITYTIFDNFNVDKSVSNASLYENNYSYITGDKALITVKSLIINGLSAYNSSRYFPRITATFGLETFVDNNNLGYINLTNLVRLSNRQNGEININIDFLEKNGEVISDRVLSTISQNIPYLFYSNYETENVVTKDEKIAVGQKANVSVYSSFDGGESNALPIKVEYTNTINNTTVTYNCDDVGVVNFQVDGGNLSKVYNNIIKVINLLTGETESFEHILSVYGDKIEATIVASSDINASLISSVKIKIVGEDVNFLAEGVTNSATGRFTVKLIPFKTYKIYYNEGNAINYLNEGVYNLVNATFENSIINLNLTLRNNNTQINNFQVYVQSKQQVISMVSHCAEDFFSSGGTGGVNAMVYGDILYSYFNGSLQRTLSSNEQIMLKCYFNFSAGYTDSKTSEAGLKYQIGKDIFLGNPDLAIYKTLTKESTDVVIISFDYYPIYSTASIILKSSGVILNSSNAVCVNYNNLTYNNQHYQQYFFARTGIEDNLIDMEITSNAYTTGKKVLKLVAFGDGLGKMLAGGINEQLASIKTAEIPSWIKFMDGMSFALSFAGQELGYQIDEEAMTISIYIGLSKTIFERNRGASYANQDTPTIAELRNAKHGGILSSGRSGFGFAVGLGGKMHFQYIDEEWKLVAGEFYISVSASYNYTKYFLIPVVNFPAFFSATISLTMTNTIMFDWDATECQTDVSGELALELMLEIEIGLGIRGLFSASVFGQGSIEVIIQYHTGGSKLTLSVCGGVRVQLIFWRYEYIFAETHWSTQSDGYEERNMDSSVYTTQLKYLKPSSTYAGIAQVMNKNSEVIMEMALNEQGQAEELVVVENVFESAIPQMAELPNGTKMIAWINQDSTRGENNSELINYIYFDGEEWSEVQVLDSTITADLYFDLKTFNNTFAISYSEVKTELNASATLSDRLQQSEIAFSIFDKNTMTFTKTRLTDNNYNDRIVMFEMSGNTGIMVVYQSQNDNINNEMTLNEFLCGENANNRLLYSIYQNDEWGEFKILQSSIPAIVNLSLKIVNSIAYIAIETDNDNNFDTTTDREILLIQYIFMNSVITMNSITDNAVEDTEPILSSFNNKYILMFKSEDNVVCYYNNNISIITALPKSQSNFSFYSNVNYAVLLWSASVEGKYQIFASIMTANTNVFSAPYQITTGDNNKSNAVATMNNENLFVYYCEDIYTPIGTDGNFSVKRNIKITAVDLFSDLEIEVLDVDTSTFTPNSTQSVTVKIYNNGNLAVENPNIIVNMNGVETTFEVIGIIKGLSFIEYNINLTMPATKTNVVFSIEKENLLESDLENNTASIDLMKVDLAITGYTITRTQSGLQVKVTIENKSFVNANNLILSLTKYSDISQVFDSINITSLLNKTENTYIINIENDNISYNAMDIFWSKLFILTSNKTIYTVEDDDYNAENNVMSLSIKRAQLEGNETLVVLNENVSIFSNQSSIINYIYTGTGTLNISSSNNQIVSVSLSRIIGVAEGTGIITLTDGIITKTINVTVINNTYSLSLNGNSIEYVLQGENFVDSGTTCLHNGEQMQGNVRITNTMDTDIIGTYQIIYEFVIENNVVATNLRTVIVKPQKAYATLNNGVISGYALNNSTVVLYDSNNNEVARTTAQNGQFAFEQLTNADDYEVVVLVEGIESDTISFTINEIENNTTNVKLIIIICSIIILLAGATFITIIIIKKRKIVKP